MRRRDFVSALVRTERFTFEQSNLGAIGFAEQGMVVNGQWHDVNGDAKPLFNFFGMPADYAGRMPWEVINRNMAWHRDAMAEKFGLDKPITLIYDLEGKALSAEAGEASRAATRDIVNVVEELLGGQTMVTDYGIHLVSMNRTDVTLYGDKAVDVRVGDRTRYGINIFNSVSGYHPPEICLWEERLVCSNGAISQNTLGRFRKTSGMTVLKWAEEAAAAAWALKDERAEELVASDQVALAEGTIANLPASLLAMRVTPRVVDAVMAQVQQEPPRTMYDLRQAITYVGSNTRALTDPLAVRRLLAIGGQVTTYGVCPECSTVVSNLEQHLEAPAE